VRPSLVLIIALTLTAVADLASPGAPAAATFAPAPIAPALGLDALTRGVARERLGRDVFAHPWATVTISNVDVYDRFPYVEARQFEIVSDPDWNRLVLGEMGEGLLAFDGQGAALGTLSGPRGLAVDERNRLYVADTGNDRVVVLQVNTEFDGIALTPLYAITGLHGPYDVAYSDGGTPFVPGDDVLYIADTGRNRVAAYAPGDAGARLITALGALGNGVGQFAGPMAVAAGRGSDAASHELYVADAHSRRIVHLRLEGSSLRWLGSAPAGADVVTSLTVDPWGNLYAAAPQQGLVRKFSPDLQPVAELRGALARPRGVHVAYSNVYDHRAGTVVRQGGPNALTVDQWDDATGVRAWNLGVAIEGLQVTGGSSPAGRFTLTDQAAVTLEVAAASDGRPLTHRSLGTLAAGVHSVELQPEDLAGGGAGDDRLLRLVAASSYAGGPSVVALAAFTVSGNGTVGSPARAALIGNAPNPWRSSTRISFVLPPLHGEAVSLDVFDAAGRRVRHFAGTFAPGVNQVDWDGTDDRGQTVTAGLFFYRLEVGREKFTRRMAFVR
jgi:DNA-binding beta-propeller fold protein YncE